MATTSGQAPFSRTLTKYNAPVAQGATKVATIGSALEAGIVTGVTYISDAAATGDATNNRVLSVINKGQDGSGTTVVATLTLLAGVNLVAFDAKNITLSEVDGATTVAAGDVLAFSSAHAASGVADGGGIVTVTIGRD